jgi:hypothetical protein
MSNLTYLDIDDRALMLDCFDTDLGCRGKIGVATLFKICKRLDTFIINGEVATRDTLYKPESRGAKEQVATAKRSWSLTQGVELNVCKNTNKLNHFAFDCLVDYTKNRNNKGLLRYSGGIAWRAFLTANATVLNVGTHVVKNLKSLFKDATTAVTEDDILA